MRLKLGVIGLALAALVFPFGVRADGSVKVVASFSILADMTKRIGGDAVTVDTLVPVDGDAHTFEPKPSDVIKVKDAQVVVTNGLALEGWINRLISSAGGHFVRVVASEGVKSRTMEEDGKKITDPHAWQDPRNGVIYANNIADGLAKADPAHATTYRANRDAYVAEIKETDSWIEQQLAAVPAKKRKIITSHDAFGYFGAHYGVTFVGVEGISTEGEPSAKDIATLIKQIKQEHIHAVFVENMTDPRIAQSVARDSGAVVGPTVYSDALSPPDGPAATYLTMFRHNVPLFAEAMAAN